INTCDEAEFLEQYALCKKEYPETNCRCKIGKECYNAHPVHHAQQGLHFIGVTLVFIVVSIEQVHAVRNAYHNYQRGNKCRKQGDLITEQHYSAHRPHHPNRYYQHRRQYCGKRTEEYYQY